MSRPRFSVLLCVVNQTTRQYGPYPTSDLLGVDYFYRVPANTEFPKWVPKLELFVRFVGHDVTPATVSVAIVRLHPDGTDRDEVYRKRFAVPFSGQPGQVVLDLSYKLMNIVLPSDGVFAVRVLRRGKNRYTGDPVWRVLATDYFEVIKSP